jgi:hypothetical protein
MQANEPPQLQVTAMRSAASVAAIVVLALLTQAAAAAMNRTALDAFLARTASITVAAAAPPARGATLLRVCDRCRTFVHDAYFTMYLAQAAAAAPAVAVQVHACAAGRGGACAVSEHHMTAPAAVLAAVERSVADFGTAYGYAVFPVAASARRAAAAEPDEL